LAFLLDGRRTHRVRFARTFPSRRERMRARLTLEHGSATPPDCVLLPDKPVSLGRGLENTIVLQDKCASKRHAEIFADGGRWRLRDLRSRNGVLVDGRRVRGEAGLDSGSEIRFGEVRFRFTSEGESDEAPTADAGEARAAATESGDTALLP